MSASIVVLADRRNYEPGPPLGPPLPDGWSWRIYNGVLVIEHDDEAVGWVALSDYVPFTAQLAHRIVAALAHDVPNPQEQHP